MSDPVSILYESLVFCCIVLFAAYDIYRKRVPDRTLAFFCPVALAAPMIHMRPSGMGMTFWAAFGFSLAGSASGFLILLTAAMISKSGTGLGGGDIKLSAVIGFVYGPYRMLEVLMIAAILSAGAALVISRKQKNKKLSIPFVPFIATGSLATLIATMT